VVPAIDRPARYNYAVNYGLWDAIARNAGAFCKVPMQELTSGAWRETLKGDRLNCIFLPMFRRWTGNERFAEELKKAGVTTVMFNNDDLGADNDNPVYRGISYIFSRVHDRQRRYRPLDQGAWLPWSVDTDYFTPRFGGSIPVSMPCSIVARYPMRMAIQQRLAGKVIAGRRCGEGYRQRLRDSRAVIATASEACPVTRAKVLEAVACGAALITEDTQYLDRYFPKDKCYIFSSLEELDALVGFVAGNPAEVEKRQRELYPYIAHHTVNLQARRVIRFVLSLLAGRPDQALLRQLQFPLEFEPDKDKRA
jgi:hypothetical protein